MRNLSCSETRKMISTSSLRWAAISSLFLVLLLSAAASAADLSGIVTLSGKPAAGIVVSIEGVQAGGVLEAAVYTIDHKNMDFTPHILVVQAGTSVEFRNSDGMPCRIYSVSPAGIFVLPRQEAMATKLTFDRPGVIEIRCADHPHIRAFLIVKENPYFAVTDSEGRYRISNLPPGRYTLQVWYEGTTLKNKAIKAHAEKVIVNIRASRPHDNSQALSTLDPARFATATLLPSDKPNLEFAGSWRTPQ